MRRSALASLFLAGAMLAGCGDALAPPRPDRAAIADAARDIAATPPPAHPPRHPQQDIAMLRRVAERTAAAAQPFCEAELGRACRFTVDLAPSRVANAYASGQDRITFTTGLMRVIRNEDELAAIMAHEMAHHIAGHIPEGTWRVEAGARIGAALGNAVATVIGFDPGLAQLGAETGAHVASLTFSKAQEREADYLGAWITARAGYDLDRAAAIWATLTQLSGDKVTSITDTHPAGPERLAQWRRVAAEIGQDPEAGPRRA